MSMKAGDTYYALDMTASIRRATVVFADTKTVVLDIETDAKGRPYRRSLHRKDFASGLASGRMFLSRGYRPRRGWSWKDWCPAFFVASPESVRLLALTAMLAAAERELKGAEYSMRSARERNLSAKRQVASLRKQIEAAQAGKP